MYEDGMHDLIVGAIREAWGRVGPGLSLEELERRRGRGQRGTFRRAVAGCCLALDARDTRLTEVASPWADRVLGWGPKGVERPYGKGMPEYGDFEMRLGAGDVRRLCGPVVIPRRAHMGEVAYLTGMSRQTIWWSVKFRRLLPVDIWPYFGDRKREEVRIRESTVVDRNVQSLTLGRWVRRSEGERVEATGRENVWGFDLAEVVRRWPAGFEQVLKRVEVVLGGRERKSGKRVEWYGNKWKRAGRFLCEGCGRAVVRVVCAVEVGDVLGEEGEGEGTEALRHQGTEGKTGGGGEGVVRGHLGRELRFRCGECWEVEGTMFQGGTAVDQDLWNCVVGRLSGFRLYGREVSMPGEVARAWGERVSEVRGTRLARMVEMYQGGMRMSEIAKEMGVTAATVNGALSQGRLLFGLKRDGRGKGGKGSRVRGEGKEGEGVRE